MVGRREGESEADRKRRQKAYLSAYYQANKEKARLQGIRYRMEHADERSESQKKYRLKNRDKIKLYQARWNLRHTIRLSAKSRARYAANREACKRRVKLYALANSELVRKKARDYARAHKQKARIRHKAWRSLNPERNLLLGRRWRANHPESSGVQKARRRAAKAKVLIVDLETITAWMKKWRGKKTARCYWCNFTFPSRTCHNDHIKALKLGGEHRVENLCVSCKTCNLKKGSRSVDRWNTELTQPVLPLAV